MNDDDNAYIVEFVSVGKNLKVIAIDPVTMREVSIVGAHKAGQKALAKLAVKKLQYVLKRDKDKDQ